MRKSDTPDLERIYMRVLPGGGNVAIEVRPMRTLWGQRRYQGKIVVERRSDRTRRAGHRAPIIGRAEAATIAGILHELFPVAQSNVAVATRCLPRSFPPQRTPVGVAKA